MKKIIPVAVILALAVLIFSLAACGNTNNSTTTTTTAASTTNNMTSLKDEGSSLMEEVSSALEGIGDDLTAEGNVTDNDSTTGLLDGLTSNNTEDTATTTPADTTVAAE